MFSKPFLLAYHFTKIDRISWRHRCSRCQIRISWENKKRKKKELISDFEGALDGCTLLESSRRKKNLGEKERGVEDTKLSIAKMANDLSAERRINLLEIAGVGNLLCSRFSVRKRRWSFPEYLGSSFFFSFFQAFLFFYIFLVYPS